MNSNLNRALSAALIAFGGVAPALAQFDYPFDLCIDPNNTAPFSNPFNSYFLQNNLFGAGIGIEGTLTYWSVCQGGGSAPVRGRIGFSLGPEGSIQDSLDPAGFGGQTDDNLLLTQGAGPLTGVPTTGGMGYARIFVQTTGTTATTADFLYGSNPINRAFIGASGRYMYTESTVNGTDLNNSIGVRCTVDVLADASRVNWRLTNNLSSGAAVGLGLWFGQSVVLTTPDGEALGVQYAAPGGFYKIPFITVPGRKPLNIQERFPGDVSTSVPSYVNFSGGQKFGFGLQVVNSRAALAPNDPNSASDQTQVDEFVLGEAPFLIDGRFFTADPNFGRPPFDIFNPPGNGNADAAVLGNVFDPSLGFVPTSAVGFVQKWRPDGVAVASGAARNIVSYYRSVNGDSSYSPAFAGYSAVVDTPKAISTNPNDPTEFSQNPFTVRVNVDNTGGFSNAGTQVRMQSVQVVLNLPAGMHAPGSTARTITRTLNRIYANGPDLNRSNVESGEIGYVDFQVEVDPNAVGALPYTATITPQPGFATKTITGTINVAATPRLLFRPGANLVSPPWQFADNSWEAVLGLDLNADFQAYTWDATLQRYIPQTAAERGRGSWIISKSDLGFRTLGGSPRQPDDQFPDPTNFNSGGAPLVRLKRGWNLIGNPYNYAFSIGQLIGIPVGQNNVVLPYNDLVRAGYTNGTFAYFDQTQKNYRYIGGGESLQPNNGYWIYANLDFDIQFPPLYNLFVRSSEPTTFRQRFNNWKLQLSASTKSSIDSQNFIGIVRNPEEARSMAVREAPMAPIPDALQSYVAEGSLEMAQTMRKSLGAQTFTYNVNTRAAGPVTIAWPNLKEIPSNLAVTVKDTVTGRSVNARSTAGYTFNAATASVRSFVVTVKPMGTVAQRIGSISATTFKAGSVKLMKINFFTSGRGGATIKVLKNGVPVGVVADDIDVVSGNNTVTWPMVDGDNLPLPDGNYTLQVTATGEGGDASTRQYAISVRR